MDHFVVRRVKGKGFVYFFWPVAGWRDLRWEAESRELRVET